MHVAVDGVGNARGGGWSVLVRTVGEIAADDRVDRITVFCSPMEAVDYAPRDHPRVAWVTRAAEHGSASRRIRWYVRDLGRAAESAGADVVLAMNGMGHTRLPSVTVVQQAFAVTGAIRKLRPATVAAKLATVRKLTQSTVTRSRHVVTQSGWMRHALWSATGVASEVLPLGLPRRPTAASTAAREPVVAWIGSPLAYKRFDVAERAIASVKQSKPSVSLQTVSNAPIDDIWALLRRSRTLLITSEIESLGLPILEAFAVGCPTLVPDLAWARSVADNGAATYKPGDARSAGRRLLEALDEPALGNDLATRGRARFDALWAQAPYIGLVDLLRGAA